MSLLNLLFIIGGFFRPLLLRCLLFIFTAGRLFRLSKRFFFLLVMNFFALDIPCFWSLNSIVKFRRKVMWHVNMKYMLQFLVYLYFFHRYIQYFKFLNGLKILFLWSKKEQTKYMMSYLEKNCSVGHFFSFVKFKNMTLI